MRAWLALVVLAGAACGGGSGKAAGSTKPAKTATKARGPSVTVAVLRERIQKLCGAAYEAKLDGNAEGCDWIRIDAWRGRAAFQATGEHVTRIELMLVGPATDVDAMRKRVLEPVADVLDADERGVVEKALGRLFQKSTAGALEASGWLSDLHVTAATSIEVEHPRERWIELQIERGRDDHGDVRTPLAATATTGDSFPTSAKEVTAKWIDNAKALCTDLTTTVSKANKLPIAPPLWQQGDLYIECKHADDNIVAQFVATWAPGTKRLVYLRFVADTPQKKFAAYADKLLAPLLSAAQLGVARTAAKKAPLDRKYEADGLQFSSRHDTGGFFGESHEIELTVQR
jgi:hypothetical protein